MLDISFPIKAGCLICRSLNNFDNSPFTTFDRLSYCPKHINSGYGRANSPNQEVFYGSESPETTFQELVPSWNNNKALTFGQTFSVILGIWRLKKGINSIAIPDFKNKKMMKYLRGIHKIKEGTAEREYFDLINENFQKQGVTDPYIYKFTSAYCNASIAKAKKIGNLVEGVLYTSLQDTRDKKGWNLAIYPEYVDHYLELVEVHKFHVLRNADQNGMPNYTQSHIADAKLDPDDRKIIW